MGKGKSGKCKCTLHIYLNNECKNAISENFNNKGMCKYFFGADMHIGTYMFLNYSS